MDLPLAVPAPLARAPAALQPEIAFYENQIAPFAERQLELLYQCVMSTIARFDIWDAAPGASTYVARSRGKISALLLFRREEGRVTVYNQQVSIAAHEIARFARAVFARYPDVTLISFYAIDTAAGAVPFPLQRCECLEDIGMALPATAQAYLGRLSGNTRSSIKRYHSKIVRDFPTFRFHVYHGAAGALLVPTIVEFSRARISAKNQVCHHSEDGTAKLVRLVMKYGVVGVASIDGRVCAGIICARVGGAWHMMVVAHDPAYNAWRLGKLCCYLSICDAIEQGGTEYHFGWGRFDYKYQLLGEHKALYRVELYRTRLHMWRHARRVLALAAAAAFRRLRLRVARARSGTSLGDRCIARAAAVARAVKRLLPS
jgi:hypothetical protein